MLARSLLSVLALAGLGACEARLSLGGRCAYTTECPTGLSCVLGRCREECLSHRDCDLGSTCLRDPATGTLGCRVLEETGCDVDADCGAGLVCAAGACAQPCAETAECLGLVCVDGPSVGRVCVEPSGGACSTGADCAWGVCEGGRCDAVRAIGAGASNTCVLLESGRIECAGDDTFFQLSAEGTPGVLPTFLRLTDAFGAAPPFEAVALGATHFCALEGGEVRCWGAGTFGQTGGPTSATPPFPDPIVATGDVREIALGQDLSCARTATQVLCWGTDRFGLLGDTAVYPSGPGTDPSRSRPAPIELADPARDIDVSFYHACAVTLDGELWCWGANDHTNLGVPDTGERCESVVVPGMSLPCATTPVHVSTVGDSVGLGVDRVTVGNQHTCVLTHDGTVRCWGANSYGQIGDGTAPGPDVTDPRLVLTGATDVQAGEQHTCALLSDGRVACWGRDTSAELGDGGGGSRTTPVYVSGIEDAVAIAIGAHHGCALAATGELSCWGSDASGQLGDGSSEPAGTRTPTLTPAVTRSVS